MVHERLRKYEPWLLHNSGEADHPQTRLLVRQLRRCAARTGTRSRGEGFMRSQFRKESNRRQRIWHFGNLFKFGSVSFLNIYLAVRRSLSIDRHAATKSAQKRYGNELRKKKEISLFISNQSRGRDTNMARNGRYTKVLLTLAHGCAAIQLVWEVFARRHSSSWSNTEPPDNFGLRRCCLKFGIESSYLKFEILSGCQPASRPSHQPHRSTPPISSAQTPPSADRADSGDAPRWPNASG